MLLEKESERPAEDLYGMAKSCRNFLVRGELNAHRVCLNSSSELFSSHNSSLNGIGMGDLGLEDQCNVLFQCFT